MGKSFKLRFLFVQMGIGELIGLENYVANDIARALIVFAVLLVLLRLLLYVFVKISLKLTSRTDTDVDDLLLKRASRPITILAFIFALRIAAEEIVLEASFYDNAILFIYSATVITIAYLVYVFIDVFLMRAWKKATTKSRTKLDDNLVHLIEGFMKVVLIILSILYVLDLWGVEVLPLLGALGIAGLAVALALQPTLSNIFAGVSMILDKSVKVGDWVVLEDGVWGVVDKVGIRSTRIKTFDNDILVLTNTKFSESRIQNVSMPEPKVRIVIPFGVAYGSDVEKVRKAVAGEIKKIKTLDKSEEINVRFLEMGDSALKFKAYFYIESFEHRLSTIDEATTRIYNILNKNGIAIPFPQVDVHLKND